MLVPIDGYPIPCNNPIYLLKNVPKDLKPILFFHSLAIEFNKVEKYALLMIFFPSQWRVYLMVICNLCKNMTVKEMVV